MQKESRCRRCERTCLTRNGFFSLLTFLLGIAASPCRTLPPAGQPAPSPWLNVCPACFSGYSEACKLTPTRSHVQNRNIKALPGVRRPRSVEGHGESPSLQRRFAAGPVPFLLRVTSGGRLSGPGGQELLNEGLSPANRGKSDVRPRHRVSALATMGADG